MCNFRLFFGIRFLIVFVVMVFFSLFCEKKSVSVNEMWIRAPLKGMQNTAGYLVINNSSNEVLELLSASSPDFKSIQLHTMIHEGDIMRMEQVKSLKAEPGKAIKLAPHGNHLMMSGFNRILKKGDLVQVTLKFKKNPSITVPLVVKKDH